MVYNRQLYSYAPFAANLATMPFLGKKKTAMVGGNTRSYTTVKRKKPRSARSSLKKLMTSTLPTKQMTSQLSNSFLHSTLYTVNLTSQIIQGNNNQTRVGDSIYLSAVKINGAYFSANPAGAYTFRIIVGYSGEEYNNTSFASGLGGSEIFLPNTFTNFTTLGIVNPRAFTVVHDSKIDVNSLIDGKVDISSFSYTVSLGGAKFDYQAAGSNLGKIKNLYVIVMADVAAGTPGTTVSGTTLISFDTIFK